MEEKDKSIGANVSKNETLLEYCTFVFLLLAFTAAVLFDSYRFYNQESLLPFQFYLPLVILFLVSRTTLTEISILGILNAKLKEKISIADKKILKMDETTLKLQKLGISQIEMNLTFLGGQEFIHEVPRETRILARDEFVAFLKEFGATEDEVRRSQKYWIKALSVAYCRSIVKHLAEMGLHDTSKEIYSLQNLKNDWTSPDPSRLHEILNKRKITNFVIEKLLDDYEHLLKTGEIRDPKALD